MGAPPWVIFASVIGCALASRAGAQEREPATPPRLESAPTVPSPSGARAVTLALAIDSEGSPTVLECDGADADCEAATRAILEARFHPAERAGEAVESRVDFRFVFDSPPPEPEPASSPPGELGVTARVVPPLAPPPAPPGTTVLPIAEARDQTGALGDPFRALGSLPGLVPILYGFPYYFVRGAPPQGTVYAYDSIPLPALFHVLALPSVIHPRMLGDLRLHRGIAPARWGRHMGGIVAADAMPEVDGVVGEAELRALDLSAFVAAREGDVRIAAATRIGYPGYFVGAIIPGGFVSYWDYQLRSSVDLGSGTRVELVSIGSHDRLFLPATEVPATNTELTFHRGELRLVRRSGATEVGGALRYGVDYASYEDDAGGVANGLSLEMGLAGARTWVAARGEGFEVRGGAEWIGRVGEYGRTGSAVVVDPLLASLSGTRRRVHGSAFVELALLPLEWLRVDLGARADVHLGTEGTVGSADPRVRVTITPSREWAITAAAGSAHAPAVWSIPAPGFSELPIFLGLQSAVQSELGVRWADQSDDGELRGLVELSGFANRHEGIVPPLFLQRAEICDSSGCLGATQPRMNQWAFGLEALARASLSRHLDLQLAYTFTYLDADPVLGVGFEFTPPWDVRHVFSLLVGYDSRDGLTIGARGFLRSGAAQNHFWVDRGEMRLEHQVDRLPWFGTLDLSVAYAWDAGWARLRVSAEMLNATFALGGEPVTLECTETAPPSGCQTQYAPAVFLPNVGLRATFD